MEHLSAAGFDIAIVGGSIAGLSAAREISRRCDANIIIIEEHNQIGEPANSSAFTFVDTVKKYELCEAVVRYYTKVGWFSFLGSKATIRLNGPDLVVLDYPTLCREILLGSRKANLEVHTGTKAIRSERKSGKILVKVTGANEGIVKCDLLIDASGSSFFSSRYFSYRIPEFYSNPYGYELDNCDIPESFLDTISFFVGMSIGTGGGWFYPITKSVCRFGIAEITRTPIFPKEKLKRSYDFASVHMQPFAQMIKNAVPRTIEAGIIPAEPMKKLVSDNIMRVGDAAGHATPHFLEGVRPCVESGTLCGKVAAEAYEKHDFSKGFLREFERTWHNQNKLLYLHLLSTVEIAFAMNDQELEETVKEQVKREDKPELFLKGLRGWFRFPFSLLTLRPNTTYLRTLARFAYHNTRWLME